jgi:hypothetical protein
VVTLVDRSAGLYFESMDARRFTILAVEVQTQAEIAALAADDLSEAVGKNDIPRMWLSIYALLSAAARLSRLLFSGRSKARARALRMRFVVADDSPLKSRNLRDFLEHFDERVDSWAERSSGRVASDRTLGPWSDAPKQADIFRHFDSMAHAVVVLGHRYELRPLINEVKRLLEESGRTSTLNSTVIFASIVPTPSKGLGDDWRS